MKDKITGETDVVEQAEQPITMSLNEILREISYQQWLISREEGDIPAMQDALQKLYEVRDKMIALSDE